MIMVGALVSGGCATKKYVRQTVDPVSGKLDQVAQQSNKQGQTLDETRATIQKDETELSATRERAMTADSRAGDALNKAGEATTRADAAGQKADQAGQKADQVGRDLGDLRSTVANLDDYKQVGQTTVNFKFNGAALSADAKSQLDQMVSNQGQFKRYFIAVEGFTDRAGGAEYNAALSRRRADAVVEYLVAQHNIPIYRIHMVGLGKLKPVDEARGRAASAKNRRVEVTLFSADQGAMAMNNGAAGSAASGAAASSTGAAGNTQRQQGNNANQHQ